MKQLNRRTWLKTSILGLGGISALPGTLYALEERQSKWYSGSIVKELPFNADPAVAMKARLLANENPFGPSEKAIKAISDSISMGNRYGHSDAAYLIRSEEPRLNSSHAD